MTHQDQDYEHIKTRGCETPDYVNTESSSPRLRTMNTSRPARAREREREREKERERERETERERERERHLIIIGGSIRHKIVTTRGLCSLPGQ